MGESKADGMRRLGAQTPNHKAPRVYRALQTEGSPARALPWLAVCLDVV